MRILLTGRPGIGKTTVIQRISLLAQPANLLATVTLGGKGFLDQIKGRNEIDMVEGDKRKSRLYTGDHGPKNYYGDKRSSEHY